MISLYESILSSTGSGKDSYYINVIKKNLELCSDIKEFSKAWTALGFDVKGFYWGYFAGKDSYVYANDSSKFLIFCMKNRILIYNDEPGLWNNDKEFKDYCKKVADVLKTNVYKSKHNKGDVCVLKF